MEKLDFEGRFVNTEGLSKIFGVSERQVRRLVKAGVIDFCSEQGKPYKFDLLQVVSQYARFIESGVPLHRWAADT